MLDVEILYAPVVGEQIRLSLTVPEGARVSDALSQSGLYQTNPEISTLSVGVFSTVVSNNSPLKAGDRIEIYRPLLIDPKEKRRQRARTSK